MNLEADRVVDFALQLPEPYSGMSMRLKKVCPQCDATLHAGKLACPCGHVFPAKAQQTKRKRPIESRQSDNVCKAARKACETGEETRKRQVRQLLVSDAAFDRAVVVPALFENPQIK